MYDVLAEPDFVIGRRSRSELKRSQARTRGGSASGLSFELEWAEDRSMVALLGLLISGKPIWGDEEQGVRVDLTSLLGHLASHWNELLLEQTYPAGLWPLFPSKLANDVNESELGVEAIRRVEAFLQRHDISSWTANSKVVSLWLMREGNNMLLDTGATQWIWPVADVVRTLLALGETIASRLEEVEPSSALLQRWRERDSLPDLAAASLATGFSEQILRSWVDDQTIPCIPGRDVLLQDLSEVMAAARMLGSVAGGGTLAELAKAIASLPSRETPVLDRLSAAANTELELASERKPYLQGYDLAHWLRQILDLREEGAAVDVRQLLQDWSVDLTQVNLPPIIEAVSVWGPQHGPAVILNPNGSRNVAGGDRASLAHEVCHLLIDRQRNLPVLEILRTDGRGRLEARANAFAAELLLPMEWAAVVYRKSINLKETLHTLVRNYGVTWTLAARQLLNAQNNYDLHLSVADKQELNSIVAPLPRRHRSEL